MELSPSLPMYTFGERLGSGTYATVYRACTKQVGTSGVRETVAIKCIDRRKLANKATAENLFQEIKILKHLRHPHIVELLDFRWDAQYIYLIMEYCSGGALAALILRQRCLAEGIVRKFLRQVASAMRYLRARNIAHMDLKPQNILLTYADAITASRRPGWRHLVLKLADFGFAQNLRGTYGSATSMRGSPLYMAPEIVSQARYDARVDLWSVGVIMYECLFGKAPFACQDMNHLMAQITSSAPIVIPERGQTSVSAECRDLLEGLLQRSPDMRITFDAFFAHPFLDLEHLPSDANLNKAERLVADAAIAENAGRTSQAFKLYCRALDYFLPCLQCIENDKEQQALRQRIYGYVERAEALKESLHVAPATLTTERSFNERDHLEQLWSDVPQVQAALTVIASGEQFQRSAEFEMALCKFELAIGSMLALLKSEPPGQRRDLLKKQVEKWMDKAEELSIYTQALKWTRSHVVEEEKRFDQTEAGTDALVEDSQCVLQ